MPTLEIQLVPTQPIYTHGGSCDGRHVAIYQPVLPPGWFFLGHLAQALPGPYTHHDPVVHAAAPMAVAVRSNDPLALSPVRPTTKLWASPASSDQQPVAIWAFRATAQGEDYVTVGLFAATGPQYANPASSPLWDALVGLRGDLVVPGRVGRAIWCGPGGQAADAGQWASLSLWSVTGQGGLVPSAGFIAAEGSPSTPVSLVPSPYLLTLR